MRKLYLKIVKLVKREPALVTGLATAAASAAATFGLHLSASQTRELYSGAAAVTAFLVRAQVTPVAKLKKAQPPTATAVVVDKSVPQGKV